MITLKETQKLIVRLIDLIIFIVVSAHFCKIYIKAYIYVCIFFFSLKKTKKVCILWYLLAVY